MVTCNGTPRLALAALLATLSTASAMPALGQDIEYRQAPDADKRMTLLLKDWDPKPMVHLQDHPVPRAKFYVIDIHNHVNDPGGIHGDEVPPAEVVKGMDVVNAIVATPTAPGDRPKTPVVLKKVTISEQAPQG